MIIFSFTVVRTTMPLQKGSSISLPPEVVPKDQHPLKRKQASLSFDESAASVPVDSKPSKNRLIRSNDLLEKTPIEVLLDLLKQFGGIKEISDETQTHIFLVTFLFDL